MDYMTLPSAAGKQPACCALSRQQQPRAAIAANLSSYQTPAPAAPAIAPTSSYNPFKCCTVARLISAAELTEIVTSS